MSDQKKVINVKDDQPRKKCPLCNTESIVEDGKGWADCLECKANFRQEYVPGFTPETYEFVFTFGCGQANAGCYHVIRATDENAARQKMFERFGNKWSMVYPNREMAGVSKYHLKEIK